jgi:Zn-dependent peptidase ImmA (M78 family)/DNA-binding XRE family transcriptional regulator
MVYVYIINRRLSTVGFYRRISMFGQRLRLARKKAGLSMQGLADRTSPKVTAQAISKYEAEKMNPSSSVLVGLSKALGVSLDFLMGGQVEALVGVEFRKHSSTSAKDRAHAEAIVIEKLEDYLAIENILEIDLSGDPFGDLVTEHIDAWDDLDKKARALRKQWKLGNDPIPSMSRLLEDKGIKVIEADFAERFDGLACEVKRSGGLPNTDVVVVSSRTNVERKRFNLAHELAHRVVRQTGNATIKLEKAMNRFAGAFLIPTDHLIEEAGQVRSGMTLMELMRLKRLYGVSAAAMLMRLGQAGILPQSSIDYAFRTYARKWRSSEPDPIRDDEGFGAFEHPQRFERLVWRALGEELISPVRAAQMLRLSLATVEENIRG